MKPFWVKFFVFFIPIILGYSYIEYQLRILPNSFNTKRKYLEKQLDSIVVIAVGGSHTTYGINPGYFSYKGFNLGNLAQDVYYDKALLIKYLDRLTKLKLVIFESDYFTYEYSLSNSGFAWRTDFYYHFFDLKSENWKPFNIDHYSLISMFTLPTVQAFIAKEFDTCLVSNLNYNGWIKADTNSKIVINDATGLERVQFHNAKCIAHKYDKQVQENVEQLVSVLRKRNIKVVFLTFPVYKTYSKFCDTAVLRENDIFVHSLCNKYGCDYKSYFTSSLFAIRDFRDNDHLNFIGAKKFSQLINKDIIIPELEDVYPGQ